ncbi:MAG TPA: S8 family serine peptidase [Thermomicrobiales bacterium]|nr:S8 family serine peptidase [Thermomicrobiales bacterium]
MRQEHMIGLFGRTKHALLYLIITAALLIPSTAGATEPPTPGTEPAQEEQAQPYIVQLRGDVSLDRFLLDRRSSLRNEPRQRFSSIINGFAADLTAGGLAMLAADPRVVGIMPDFEVRASAQTIPTGVRRVGATTSGAANINGVDDTMSVDVAVLDTGVSSHSDLRVAGGVNCVGGTSYSDDHGHGTHVAGTIAAIDNGSGVVGVAPGARIWSVKVLNSSGSGSGSSLLCGIDWVTARAGTIEVANMSLGGTGYLDDNNCGNTNGDIIHQAVCRSVAAGITYVVAAGNNGKDAKQYFPANYDEVITVSALVDTDGLPGGLGGSTAVGADDTLASFSNYGADVDVIAPGVLIYSTARTGGYTTMSGTSMAAPHVAGAAALYKLVNPGATPAAVRSALISTGSSAGWSGDKDSFKEPLINVSTFGGSTTPPPPPPATIDAQVVSVSMPSSVTQGATATVTVAVKNNGSASASISVALNGSPNGFGQTKSVTIAAGSTSNVTFSWATTTSTATGTHTFTATSTLSGDGNAANNTASTTTTVVAPASVTTTMSVSSLSFTQRKATTSSRITAVVTIKSNGVVVSGAAVTARFTYPNGSIYSMTATTNSKGLATFTRTVTSKGKYTVTVANVAKTGFTYNAAGNSVTSRSLTY